MLEYLLKSSACLVAFLLFYQFLLEKEPMHQFKRFFLLGALIASLTIPALVFTEYVEAFPQQAKNTPSIVTSENLTIVAEPATDMDVINWPMLLWTIYGIGALVFALRFIKHLFQILQRIRKNPKLRLNAITQVFLKEHMPPHTFFSYVFLNKKAMEKKAIPKEVLLHEETHAKQYHSLDVLFIELLQVVFWFNPLFLLFKRRIKLNHEFLADGAVLKENVPTKNYQNTLLSFLSAASANNYQSIKMANTIIYSSTRAERSRGIKKRFAVMKKQTSRFSTFLRVVLILPLLASLLYSFSEKNKIYQTETKHTIEGLWLDELTENFGFSIITKGNELFLYQEDTFFPIIEYSNSYQVITKTIDVPLRLDNKTGLLHFGNKKFIHQKNSLKNQFQGIWIDNSGENRIEVQNFTDGFIWTFTKNGSSNKFYPKRKNDSFLISYDGKIWSFKIENDVLIDSNGKTYAKTATPQLEYSLKESNIEGLNSSQLLKYNELATKYKKNHFGASRMLDEELNLMYKLQSKMNNEQKGNSYSKFGFPKVIDTHNRKGMPKKQIDLYDELAKKYNSVPIAKRKIPLNELRTLETIYRRMTAEQKEMAQPFPECLPKNLQKGASREQMKEYNALAKKYNEMSRENMRVKIKEVERMKYIYGLMSDKQKADAEPFPEFPIPPEMPTFRSPPEVREVSPPTPIVPKDISDHEYASNKIDSIVENQDPNDSPNIDISSAAPPPPPTPPSPLDHVIEMAKKGATFYYEGKEISSDRAIELIKSNEDLNIQTTKSNSKNPQVKISKKPIVLKRG